jgi:NAD dependent epimerase/dehydratase
MKVFVTGADGFIGSHLVERLIKLGHKVKAFTFYNFRGSNGWLDSIDKKLLKELHIISGDIRDYSFLEKQTKNIDVIYHLAALIAIPYSYHSPQSYIDTNITGTYNVLKSSQINNISKIIITSTSEVYGTAQTVPIKENHSLNAQSPYAATKIAADQLALSFYKSFDLPVTILRPFNTYGPRQSARAVIPTIISQLVSKNKFIKIGNLTPTRDFTYIDDTVEAFILALKKNISGEVINIGNKFEISIKGILDIFKKDFNYDFKVVVDEKRRRSKKSEVFRLLAGDFKAKRLLKWNPKYQGITGFKKGLDRTIEWFNNPDNIRLYNPDIYNL